MVTIKRKIYRTGHAHSIIIPKFIMEAVGVKAGDYVNVTFQKVSKK